MRQTLRSLRASTGPLGLAGLLVLGGCASGPPKGAAVGSSPRAAVLADGVRDGAEANPPVGLDAVPDAEPRVEAIRSGGPNKPYEALGRTYVPFTEDRAFVERGLASWYGRKFHGRRTSSGEPYDMYAMTAAHPTLPIPSYARVRNPANGREIVVRVNDRGPFHPGRIIDLSYTAALRLDLLRGVAPVEVERLTWSEIRAGTWRRGAPADSPLLASALPPTALSSIAASAAETALATPAPSAEARLVASAETRPAVGAAPAVFTADAATLSAGAAPGFWVQLGAFRQRDGATAFQRRIAGEFDWLSPWLAVVADAPWFRLQAGPYPSRDQARDAAESIRAALQLVPMIVERR
jgi:rare lipoprotein A